MIKREGELKRCGKFSTCTVVNNESMFIRECPGCGLWLRRLVWVVGSQVLFINIVTLKACQVFRTALPITRLKYWGFGGWMISSLYSLHSSIITLWLSQLWLLCTEVWCWPLWPPFWRAQIVKFVWCCLFQCRVHELCVWVGGIPTST